MNLNPSGMLATAAAAVTAAVSWNSVTAQDVRSVGNGGVAGASANGGSVSVGDINSDGMSGSAIAVGDSTGGVEIDGGTMTSSTSLSLTADGGAALADASGGDGNSNVFFS